MIEKYTQILMFFLRNVFGMQHYWEELFLNETSFQSYMMKRYMLFLKISIAEMMDFRI